MTRLYILRRRLGCIFRHELRIFAKRPIFLFCMIIAPLAVIFFFTYLMGAGLPTDLPAGIVDEDNTSVTRLVAQVLNSFEETNVKYKYSNFHEARRAMQRREIYGFYYLPPHTTRDAESNGQPRLSFYTNDCYYVPGNLLFKDMKTASELIPLALERESLFGHGYSNDDAMDVLQPIALETHPINNPQLNYSVYLSNMLVPGIIILLILLSTTYTIGLEWKQKTQKIWFRVAGYNPAIALLGKLLPQTIIFCLEIIFMDVYFFVYLGFPLSLRHLAHDRLGRAHRAGLAGLWRVSVWLVGRSVATGDVHLRALGNPLVLLWQASLIPSRPCPLCCRRWRCCFLCAIIISSISIRPCMASPFVMCGRRWWHLSCSVSFPC